jgi:LacI family transcriptional regulator
MKDRRNEAPEPVVPAAPAPRARLADIARLAGVSSATADRVINHRPGVRTATMHRVLKVAAEMGYLPASDLMASLRPKPMQLVFLLPTGTNRYFRLLANYIDYAEEQLADLNVRCRYHFVEGLQSQRARRAVATLRPTRRRNRVHGAGASAGPGGGQHAG